MADGGGQAPVRADAPFADAASWIVLALLVVIWGSAFAAISISVETIAPVWVVAGRMVIAAAFLGGWLAGQKLLARGKVEAAPAVRLARRTIVWYSVIGVVFTAVPFLLYAIAAKDAPSAVLAICNGGTPFFTALAAHMFIAGERLTAKRAMGVALGFLGLVILVWPDLAAGATARLSALVIAIFGAALYAGSNVMTRAGPPLSAVTASLVMVASGGVVMLIVAPFIAPWPDSPSIRSIIGMVYLGLMPTGWAFILYVWLVRRAGSVFTSFTTYLSPLWAMGLGVMFLGEDLLWTSMAALGVILAGVAVANLRFRRAPAS